jgi:uncharacterized RDD family membrane protein YckC
MSWYYAQNEKQTGPVTDAEFEALVQNGVVNEATLVWREGMANWQPYQQVRSATGTAASAPGLVSAPGTPAGVVTASTTAPGSTEVVCAECRQIFSRDNAINYGTIWVCSACKPLFVQKLKEGAATPFLPVQNLVYAGFWIRFVARFIDGLIAFAVVTVPLLLVSFFMGVSQGPNSSPSGLQILLQVVLQIFGFFFGIAYNTFFVGRYAATPGKMAVGIRVVAPDGSRINYMRAFGRAWADILSSMTCLIGYIIAAFDNEKRALHDHICTTRVVYK